MSLLRRQNFVIGFIQQTCFGVGLVWLMEYAVNVERIIVCILCFRVDITDIKECNSTAVSMSSATITPTEFVSTATTMPIVSMSTAATMSTEFVSTAATTSLGSVSTAATTSKKDKRAAEEQLITLQQQTLSSVQQLVDIQQQLLEIKRAKLELKKEEVNMRRAEMIKNGIFQGEDGSWVVVVSSTGTEE